MQPIRDIDVSISDHFKSYSGVRRLIDDFKEEFGDLPNIEDKDYTVKQRKEIVETFYYTVNNVKKNKTEVNFNLNINVDIKLLGVSSAMFLKIKNMPDVLDGLEKYSEVIKILWQLYM